MLKKLHFSLVMASLKKIFVYFPISFQPWFEEYFESNPSSARLVSFILTAELHAEISSKCRQIYLRKLFLNEGDPIMDSWNHEYCNTQYIIL